MRTLIYISLVIVSILKLSAQDTLVNPNEEHYDYYIIEGDTIPRTAIDLNEVIVLKRLKFEDKDKRRTYLILRRKTRKVYPYAKTAAERLVTLNNRLDSIKSKSGKKKYTKIIHKYLEDEFAQELKKLTRTEGQILIKLINRQTGETAFELVKRLRNGWKAFWYNTTASAFDISLKREFDPFNIEEDYLIEDILQRSFQSGILDPQSNALGFEYLELSDKWKKTTSESN